MAKTSFKVPGAASTLARQQAAAAAAAATSVTVTPTTTVAAMAVPGRNPQREDPHDLFPASTKLFSSYDLEEIVRASEKILGVPTPVEKEWRIKLDLRKGRQRLELQPPSRLQSKKVAQKPKAAVPPSPVASVSESSEDEGRMLVDLIDKDAAQIDANIENAASVLELPSSFGQVETPAAQENLPQDGAPVNEGGAEVAARSTLIPNEATTVAPEEAPTVEDLTENSDSDEDFGVAFNPPSSPMLTRRQDFGDTAKDIL
ncbi:hypothetical protein GUJ93_ZPchr0001g30254 [Zizania palustris]|uniref:Uncharacterized protein n=1 Tax=Zizania palustris TaxID=103762 RepID=A0A8J5SBP8_ZIZPA|nr:hypothetical protein GUJ93_ZPchr0001g30254 [Zizania palustris]